jgi:hypothetical protein
MQYGGQLLHLRCAALCLMCRLMMQLIWCRTLSLSLHALLLLLLLLLLLDRVMRWMHQPGSSSHSPHQQQHQGPWQQRQWLISGPNTLSRPRARSLGGGAGEGGGGSGTNMMAMRMWSAGEGGGALVWACTAALQQVGLVNAGLAGVQVIPWLFLSC